jgi:hypothetical protein
MAEVIDGTDTIRLCDGPPTAMASERPATPPTPATEERDRGR